MSLTILLLTTELNESGSCSGVAFDVATECVLYFGCAVQETPSALGMFHVMRYINVRYLLTYILTLCRRKSKFLMKIKYKTVVSCCVKSRVRRTCRASEIDAIMLR